MMYPRRRRDVRRAYLCRGVRVRVDLVRVRAVTGNNETPIPQMPGSLASQVCSM